MLICIDFRSLVFGGFDGIMSTLVIMSGAAGCSLSWRSVAILAIACSIANAFFTGMSEFLSFKAHREFIQAEKRREMWEFKHYKEAEISEMVNRFEQRGMARRDAEIVVGKMAQYESFFVGQMVSEELGLQPPDNDDGELLTDAFVMFVSYSLFGALPILVYCIGGFMKVIPEQSMFPISAAFSLVVLSCLGIMKSFFSSSHWFYCFLESLILGGLVAAISYFVSSKLVLWI